MYIFIPNAGKMEVSFVYERNMTRSISNSLNYNYDNTVGFVVTTGKKNLKQMLNVA